MNQTRELWEWVRSIGIAVILAILIRLFLFEVFIVEGASMHPTLENSERLVINKLTYRFDEPSPGDIVVFNYSQQRDFIKRVIGVGGDTIQIVAGVVYRNGVPLDEPYLLESVETEFGPIEVPYGHIFLMGDNRNNSMDSRDPNVGSVSLERVKGKAFFVFWPLPDSRLLGRDDPRPMEAN